VCSLTLSDDALCTLPDLGGEFFLRKEDLHKPKAICYAPRVQALNPRGIFYIKAGF
jgi:molybdopterin/thiamine biosynthesis adenylyltransferase